jgi:hypothetical protein
METVNPSGARAVQVLEMKPRLTRESGFRGLDFKSAGGTPSADELSPAFRKLSPVPSDAQELRNHFAHLLNRGSPLE